MALVAERSKPLTGETEILGVSRLQKLTGTTDAEFAIVVADQYQGHGLGSELMRRLLEIAKDEKVRKVRADILADNTSMQRLCEHFGFRMHREINDPTVDAELDLG